MFNRQPVQLLPGWCDVLILLGTRDDIRGNILNSLDSSQCWFWQSHQQGVAETRNLTVMLQRHAQSACTCLMWENDVFCLCCGSDSKPICKLHWHDQPSSFSRPRQHLGLGHGVDDVMNASPTTILGICTFATCCRSGTDDKLLCLGVGEFQETVSCAYANVLYALL